MSDANGSGRMDLEPGASIAHDPRVTVVRQPVRIPTPDGVCDAVLASRREDTARPAIILYPDVVGLRPVTIGMAARLAAAGFVVLAVNQFYRVRPAPVFADSFSMADPNDFAEAMQLLSTLDGKKIERDAVAFGEFLSERSDVAAGSRIGAIGFCMGGGMAIRTAAALGERVGAVVSMHGGHLVGDKPDSPHRLLQRTSATYYIGVAADDDAKRPDDRIVLADALRSAGLVGKVEFYPDANHGWTVPDARAYNGPAAERGWDKLVATFKQALS